MEVRKIGEIKEELKATTETELQQFIQKYSTDERAGVKTVVNQAQKRLEKYEKELLRIDALKIYERKYADYAFICGIDEVGRGPLAGPVVAGAVILPKDCNILYINDSKGTNPDSTLQALLAYDRPMVLILGGYDKKSSFDSLMPLIKEKVHHVVILGETSPVIKKMLDDNNYKNYALAGSDFVKAVDLAVGFAQSGDVVMLSPACASWDMFKCFEDRGNLFKELVNKL